jgi:hypothetical protein
MMDGAWLAEEFLNALGGRALTPRPRCTHFARSPATHRVLYGRAPRLRHGALRTPFGRESPPRGTVSRIVELNRELGEVERDTEFEFDLILYDIRERL